MLADDIARELPFLRAQAESRMQSRVTVHRAGDQVEDADGFESDGWAATSTDVPFRLDGSGTGDGGSRRITIGGVEYEQATGIGHLPHDFADLKDGDVLQVTAGEWAGAFYRVVKATKKDQATARRVPVEEIEKPAGL